MKKHTLILGIFLIGLSVLLHVLHIIIFKDAHHLMKFLVADIAFIPLEVFFVSLVLDQLIEKREHRQTVKKINMLVGLFYQELGNDLLSMIVSVDNSISFEDTKVNMQWDDQKYLNLRNTITKHIYKIDIKKLDLLAVDVLIREYQPMIMNLITNEALFEHAQFTEVLMSVSHLSEELRHRPLSNLSKHDFSHIKIDMERVYKNLAIVWVDYLKYLQSEYPYLYRSAVTNNPFDLRARAEIEEDIIIKNSL